MNDRTAQRRLRHIQPKQAPRPLLPGEIKRVRINRPANDNKSGLATQVIGVLACAALLITAGALTALFFS